MARILTQSRHRGARNSMSALFDFLAILVKRLLIAVFLVGGLLLGMLIAIKVLIVVSIVHLVRRLRGPRAKAGSAKGNVFEGEYSVVDPDSNRATILMVQPPTKPSAGA
jgi:hypothetical protein